VRRKRKEKKGKKNGKKQKPIAGGTLEIEESASGANFCALLPLIFAEVRGTQTQREKNRGKKKREKIIDFSLLLTRN
jgi:hypothetical protein